MKVLLVFTCTITKKSKIIVVSFLNENSLEFFKSVISFVSGHKNEKTKSSTFNEQENLGIE